MESKIKIQVEQRRQAARKAGFIIADIPDRNHPGSFSVTDPRSRRSYRVTFQGDGCAFNSCDCTDFRTGGIGTCKHVEGVAQWLAAVERTPDSRQPRNSGIDVCYLWPRRLRLRLGEVNQKAIAMAAMRYFDDDMAVVPGMITDLPTFIEQARRLDPRFHISSDALGMILDERDRSRRQRLVESMDDTEIGSVLRTRLYPYQIEGIRFAFAAGRLLIADEMGLGKTVQALGTVELFKTRRMVSSALIICPTSLKYQWKHEIERFTGSDVTVVEGTHELRRSLYTAPSFYKIVSYHTLANDIKALDGLHYDVVVMDDVQRLKNWGSQIAQAAGRVGSEYAVVLSGTPLDGIELADVMEYVDRYAADPLNDVHLADLSRCSLRRTRADVGGQLPLCCNQLRLVPMTKEQQSQHDQYMATTLDLARKWRQRGFLSEKDRKRLMTGILQMRMVCDSTYLTDQRTRYGTKVAETVQLVKDAIANGYGKIVIFSRWERMIRLISEELEREGIGYEYLHGGIRFASDASTHVFLATDAGSPSASLQVASVIINVDLPWNSRTLDRRIERVYADSHRHIQIFNLIATGSIEERMSEAGKERFAGIREIADGQITIDDSLLTEIVDILLEITDSPASDTDTFLELYNSLTPDRRATLSPLLTSLLRQCLQ